MANEIDLSLLTTDDYQDYWNQFLRFYADESGKNFSKKIPISYLDKVLRDEIIEKYKLNVPSYSSRKYVDIVKQLIQKGAIEFETFRPEQKFTEKYANPLSKIISRIKINPKYKITVNEDRPNEIYVRVDIDTDDWLKLSNEDKREANNFHGELTTNIQKFLGVEFGSPAHGKLNMNGYGTNVMNGDEWITNVMNKKIKKEIKESIFNEYIQRMSIKITNDKLKISIISPRNRGMNRYWEVRTQFEKFMKDLFEKYGYNKDSFELDFV
jgi:hypothetical protein